MRRGLTIARESGNRFNETHLMANLAQVEVEHGDPLSGLDHINLAIRHLHDSGNTVTLLRSPLTNLAICLDRVGHYEPAAIIAGSGFSPLTATSFPPYQYHHWRTSAMSSASRPTKRWPERVKR